VESIDDDVGDERRELGTEIGRNEGAIGSRGGVGIGPDRERQQSTVIVTAERATQNARLVIHELGLYAFVDRAERALVDTGRKPKRQDLEHDDDATFR